VEESEVVPVLVLPNSYEEYIQSLGRKNRHELRRKLRKLETLGHIRTEQVSAPVELSEAIKRFISLHKKSSSAKHEFWQMHGMSDFFFEVTHLFSFENWVELNILYVEDKWIASLLNFQYEETSYFYNIAYDRDFSAYSPGFYLFDFSIKQAIAKNKRITDFLRGREKYKYFFGAKDSRIYNLILKKRERPL
jgi:CelD/BcsL family acetyltransferase involved in cellulose biosynthesis